MEHKKWQYIIISPLPAIDNAKALEEWLNLHGKNGLELVSIKQQHYIFKRPILSQPEQ